MGYFIKWAIIGNIMVYRVLMNDIPIQCWIYLSMVKLTVLNSTSDPSA